MTFLNIIVLKQKKNIKAQQQLILISSRKRLNFQSRIEMKKAL